jgi:hypothetical protein
MALLDIHVVYLLHGLWGNPTDMHALRDSLQLRADKEETSINIYCCQSYRASKSYDGIDVCADRVIDEITQHMNGLSATGRRVRKFSILGYAFLGPE